MPPPLLNTAPRRVLAAKTEDGAYGSDATGLIWGFLFQPETPDQAEDTVAPPRSVNLSEAQHWLAQTQHPSPGLPQETPPVPTDVLWLHVNLAHNAAERWLREHAHLPEAFFETLKGGLHSTRVERAEESLLAVINDLKFDFDFEPTDTATLWICLHENVLITGRRKPLRSVDQLRVAVREGEPVRSAADLLAQLLRHQADVLVDLVRQVTTQIDDIEDRLLAERLNHKRVKLGAMRRLLVRLQRLLLPEPAALFRLLQHPPLWLGEDDQQDLRGATEEFSLVLRDMVALQERVKLLQEEVAAQINEQNNRSLFVLSIVTVLALPINIIAGLLGMNVGGIPLANHEHGFLIVVSIVIAFTLVAAWVTLRRKG